MREGYKDTPIGMIPKDWDVVRLGDIAELIMSNVDKKNHSNENEVLLCNYLDVYENEYIREGLKFMSATASDAEIERFLLKKGDVIVTKDSETKEDIAHASAVVQDFENTLCGYHLALIRPIKRNFDNIFLSKLFNINSIHKELVNKANGTTRYGLTVGTFEKLIIPFPPVSEQNKIASILFTVDDKIDAINERITQTYQVIILSLHNSSDINTFPVTPQSECPTFVGFTRTSYLQLRYLIEYPDCSGRTVLTSF